MIRVIILASSFTGLGAALIGNKTAKGPCPRQDLLQSSIFLGPLWMLVYFEVSSFIPM